MPGSGKSSNVRLWYVNGYVMIRYSFCVLLIAFSFCIVAVQSSAQIPDGVKPAPTNIQTNNCPCIFPDLRIFFKVAAPSASKVQLDLGKLYMSNSLIQKQAQ